MLDKPLLVYDGVCNLCVTAARFLHRLDRYELFNYMAFQEATHETFLPGQLQGEMCLILEDGTVMNGSFAISKVCRLLFPVSFLCKLLESPPAQKIYAWLVKRRYGLFGCKQSCFTFEDA